jgi:hypothetical protein
VIIFDLKCLCSCQFEGWFENRTDFEKQRDDGLITCPYCGCREIHKILSPVAIRSSTVHQDNSPTATDNSGITSEQAMNFFRSVQDYVEKNFEDVGAELAKESLKIHYGVAEPRNIRGVATEDEEKMLSEEGMKLLKIPMLKKNQTQN